MANIEWAETEGRVASVEPMSDLTAKKAFRVQFAYKVDDHWYGGSFVSDIDPYVEGQKLTVRYDPKDPSTNDLEKRDNRRRWLTYAALIVAGLIILALRLMGFR